MKFLLNSEVKNKEIYIKAQKEFESPTKYSAIIEYRTELLEKYPNSNIKVV